MPPRPARVEADCSPCGSRCAVVRLRWLMALIACRAPLLRRAASRWYTRARSPRRWVLTYLHPPAPQRLISDLAPYPPPPAQLACAAMKVSLRIHACVLMRQYHPMCAARRPCTRQLRARPRHNNSAAIGGARPSAVCAHRARVADRGGGRAGQDIAIAPAPALLCCRGQRLRCAHHVVRRSFPAALSCGGVVALTAILVPI